MNINDDQYIKTFIQYCKSKNFIDVNNLIYIKLKKICEQEFI